MFLSHMTACEEQTEVKQISRDDGASNSGEVILITTPSHLGRILSVGDEVMGYDVAGIRSSCCDDFD